MELSLKEAYECLQIPFGSPFVDVVKQYKHSALEWYPSRHLYADVAKEKFLDVSRALLVIYFAQFSLHFSTAKRSVQLNEMLAFFHYMFFREENFEEDDDDADDNDYDEYFDSTGEESFEESDSDTSLKYGDIYNDLENKLSEYIDGKAVLDHAKKEKVQESAVNADQLIQEEEREKKKANKRKAQKKRRKERKKQQKSVQKTETKKPTEKSEEQKMTPESSSSESEEDIDPTSAFVAGIAKKKIPNIPIKKEGDTKTKSNVENQAKAGDDGTSRVLRSRQLALRGNEMANLGHFQEAVELFTEAIKLDPTDHRFHGNRSYCHERIGNYERAVKDAEKSIALAPKVPKGYFRKGKALISLKRFAEAEKLFETVIKMDPRCEDAEKELLLARICQITDMGFTKEQAEAAIQEHDSVHSALDYLLATVTASGISLRKEEVFISDDEDDNFLMPGTRLHAQQAASDVKMDPNNPEGHNSIWIGNIQTGVTEKILMSLFAKYGDIISVRIMPEKFCAFVNYKYKGSAGKAMLALQGAELFGANLKIRYPEANAAKSASSSTQGAPKSEKLTGPVNGDECYFWRTTGCIYGSNCRFRHVPQHKGIDKKHVPYKL